MNWKIKTNQTNQDITHETNEESNKMISQCYRLQYELASTVATDSRAGLI